MIRRFSATPTRRRFFRKGFGRAKQFFQNGQSGGHGPRCRRSKRPTTSRRRILLYGWARDGIKKKIKSGQIFFAPADVFLAISSP